MMTARFDLEWATSAPPGGGGLYGVDLYFPPTRSTIETARLLTPGGKATVLPNQVVRALFAAPIEAGASVRLRLVGAGEPLGDPLLRWHSIAVPHDVPVSREDWKLVYDERDARTQRDGGGARFFFDIDRRSLPALLVFNPEFAGEAARKTRCALVSEVMRALTARLFIRYQRRSTRGVVQRVPEITHMIRKCIPPEWKPGDWAPIIDAFERFGAGGLRHEIPLRPGDRSPYPAGEPDSYYICMFAELAIAAIEHPLGPDSSMWSALLPTLVKIQEYYFARPPHHARMLDYRTPSAPLDKAVQDRIDLDYRQRNYDATKPADVVRLKVRIGENLRGAASRWSLLSARAAVGCVHAPGHAPCSVK